ncbi:hypothetical protein P7C70_g4572, partial [Phenoliferia sp. Uapishka_3]
MVAHLPAPCGNYRFHHEDRLGCIRSPSSSHNTGSAPAVRYSSQQNDIPLYFITLDLAGNCLTTKFASLALIPRLRASQWFRLSLPARPTSYAPMSPGWAEPPFNAMAYYFWFRSGKFDFMSRKEIKIHTPDVVLERLEQFCQLFGMDGMCLLSYLNRAAGNQKIGEDAYQGAFDRLIRDTEGTLVDNHVPAEEPRYWYREEMATMLWRHDFGRQTKHLVAKNPYRRNVIILNGLARIFRVTDTDLELYLHDYAFNVLQNKDCRRDWENNPLADGKDRLPGPPGDYEALDVRDLQEASPPSQPPPKVYALLQVNKTQSDELANLSEQALLTVAQTRIQTPLDDCAVEHEHHVGRVHPKLPSKRCKLPQWRKRTARGAEGSTRRRWELADRRSSSSPTSGRTRLRSASDDLIAAGRRATIIISEKTRSDPSSPPPSFKRRKISGPGKDSMVEKKKNFHLTFVTKRQTGKRRSGEESSDIAGQAVDVEGEFDQVSHAEDPDVGKAPAAGSSTVRDTFTSVAPSSTLSHAPAEEVNLLAQQMSSQSSRLQFPLPTNSICSPDPTTLRVLAQAAAFQRGFSLYVVPEKASSPFSKTRFQLTCTRGRPKFQERKCPFYIVVGRNVDSEIWSCVRVHGAHNHDVPEDDEVGCIKAESTRESKGKGKERETEPSTIPAPTVAEHLNTINPLLLPPSLEPTTTVPWNNSKSTIFDVSAFPLQLRRKLCNIKPNGHHLAEYTSNFLSRGVTCGAALKGLLMLREEDLCAWLDTLERDVLGADGQVEHKGVPSVRGTHLSLQCRATLSPSMEKFFGPDRAEI